MDNINGGYFGKLVNVNVVIGNGPKILVAEIVAVPKVAALPQTLSNTQPALNDEVSSRAKTALRVAAISNKIPKSAL